MIKTKKKFLRKAATSVVLCLSLIVSLAPLSVDWTGRTLTLQETRAATLGPNFPASAVNDTSAGTTAWSNPGNAVNSDDVDATVSQGRNTISNYLKATSFGFSIPSDATIQGIQVEWEKREAGVSGTNKILDSAVRIVKNGAIGATDRSSASDWPTADTFVSHGGAADLWGDVWSAADINSSNFGAAISVVVAQQAGGQQSNETAEVDSVRITITYAVPLIDQSAYRWFENKDGEVEFGTGGIVTGVSATTEARSFAEDSTYFYIAGTEGSPSTDWRIEKMTSSTGALCTAAACGTEFGTAGAITSTGGDKVYDIAVDSTHMYVVGGDGANWRIEKRLLSTGALDSGFGTSGVVTGASGEALSLTIDSTYMYVAGYSGSDWRIEKRFLSTGALETSFDGDGIVTSIAGDKAYGIDIDSSFIYVVGPNDSSDWLIEKRSISDGSLDSSFGTSGAVTGANITQIAYGIVVDDTYMYVTGDDGNLDWRTEKRLLSNGGLVTAFGSGGIATSTSVSVAPQDIVLNGSHIYVAGYEAASDWRIEKRDATDGSLDTSFDGDGVVTSTAGNKIFGMGVFSQYIVAVGDDGADWRIEKRRKSDGALALKNVEVGTPLAAQDATSTTPGQGIPFRLRLLMHVSTDPLSQNNGSFKLQVAERSGTCDIAFSGEAYSDVLQSSGVVRFYDNPSAADGDALTSGANDPIHGADVIRNQSYEEANNFTNSVSAISAGEDGKWDFALVDNSAPNNTSYCFRVVKSDGSLLDSYTVIPEIMTRGAPAVISSAANQVFSFGQGPAGISQISITAGSGSSGAITAGSDIRIKIASSSVDMEWDTADTSASLGGTAVSKASATVSYPDPYTLLINVTSDFVSGENLTVSDLAFRNFNSVNKATSTLMVFVDGENDTVPDDRDDKTIAIRGTYTLSEHDLGQVPNQFNVDGTSITSKELFRFKLTSAGENANTGTTTISLTSVYGFNTSNITNARLFKDDNGNGLVDGSESALGLLGSVSVNSNQGTIVLGGAWIGSGATQVILRADVSGIGPSDYIIFSLPASNITAKGENSLENILPSGSVADVNHARSSSAGGGGGGSSGGSGTSGGGSDGGDTEDPGGGGTGGGDPGGGGGEAP